MYCLFGKEPKYAILDASFPALINSSVGWFNPQLLSGVGTEDYA
ncbi:hypothetical protein AAGF08_18910 [Algoriphagus sp. SE2]